MARAGPDGGGEEEADTWADKSDSWRWNAEAGAWFAIDFVELSTTSSFRTKEEIKYCTFLLLIIGVYLILCNRFVIDSFI